MTQREIAIALWQAGIQQVDIAIELGVSGASVSRYIARYKAKAAREGVCPCCGRKLPPTATKEATDAA